MSSQEGVVTRGEDPASVVNLDKRTLKNFNATCYINSSIQFLRCMPELFNIDPITINQIENCPTIRQTVNEEEKYNSIVKKFIQLINPNNHTDNINTYVTCFSTDDGQNELKYLITRLFPTVESDPFDYYGDPDEFVIQLLDFGLEKNYFKDVYKLDTVFLMKVATTGPNNNCREEANGWKIMSQQVFGAYTLLRQPEIQSTIHIGLDESNVIKSTDFNEIDLEYIINKLGNPHEKDWIDTVSQPGTGIEHRSYCNSTAYQDITKSYIILQINDVHIGIADKRRTLHIKWPEDSIIKIIDRKKPTNYTSDIELSKVFYTIKSVIYRKSTNPSNENIIEKLKSRNLIKETIDPTYQNKLFEKKSLDKIELKEYKTQFMPDIKKQTTETQQDYDKRIERMYDSVVKANLGEYENSPHYVNISNIYDNFYIFDDDKPPVSMNPNDAADLKNLKGKYEVIQTRLVLLERNKLQPTQTKKRVKANGKKK